MFKTFILDASPNEHFEYGYPHSNVLLCLFVIKIFVLSQIRAQALCHPTKCDIISDDIADILSQISDVI